MESILKLEPNVQATVVMFLWLLWDERNKRREEGRWRPGVEVAYIAAALADRQKQAQPSPPLPDFRQRRCWQKPDHGVLKIYSDGAFLAQSGEGSWGYVTRDSLGHVKKAGGGSKHFLQSAFHAELLGALEGLKMAVSLGMTHVTLETDVATVKTALVGSEYRFFPMGGVITEIQHLMVTEFSSCRVNVCPRDCNKLAHELAL